MNENKRLQVLYEYEILDTAPEHELDQITELASIICETPISLISLTDKDRQWFKSKVGMEATETSREYSMCNYIFQNPDEILVVPDSTKDERFSQNPMVLGEPRVRFYAGVPLRTPEGDVLGSLCVIGKKPGNLSDSQRKALEILSNKVMKNLNYRKLIISQKRKIEGNAARLKLLTDRSPGVIFQLKYNNGKYAVQFVSKGLKNLNSSINVAKLSKDPMQLYKYIHEEDREPLRKLLHEFAPDENNLKAKVRMFDEKGEIRWLLVNVQREKSSPKTWTLYGNVQDITFQMKYEEVLEQISFDISHGLRNPVTSLLGLTNLMEEEKDLTRDKLMIYGNFIKTISSQLDSFTRDLNGIYEMKKNIFLKGQ